MADDNEQQHVSTMTVEEAVVAETAVDDAGTGTEASSGGERFLDVSEVKVDEGTPTIDQDARVRLLRDVSLKVRVELGRGKMLLRNLLRLTKGSVVELERRAGDPLDIYVNDRLVGRGEVVVVDEKFCIRITEILAPEDCLRVKTD